VGVEQGLKRKMGKNSKIIRREREGRIFTKINHRVFLKGDLAGDPSTKDTEGGVLGCLQWRKVQ